MSTQLVVPPTTTLADAAAARGITASLVPPLATMVAAGAPVIGRAVTVTLAPGSDEPGLMPLYDVLSRAQDGAVLVIGGARDVSGAVFGQILGRAALQVGVRAAVVDGPVRDVELLREDGLPLVAASRHCAGAVGAAHVVAAGEAVRIGEASIADGDVLVVDSSGAVVLPAAQASALLRDGADLAEAEARVIADLDAGVRLHSAYAHKRAVTERLRRRTPALALSSDHGGED